MEPRYRIALLLTLVACFLSLGVWSYATETEPTVIDFEDLAGHAGVPSGYYGIEWGPWTYYDEEQEPYTPSSGIVRVYTTFAAASMDFGIPVTFYGAYFAGDDEPETLVQFEGYRKGVLVGTSTPLAVSATPVFLNADFGSQVDLVVVTSNRPQWWCMDDVTFEAIPSVNGTIRSSSGVTLGGVSVGALQQRPADAVVQTDGSGYYEIYGLEPGSYYIIAFLSGYKIGIGQVQITGGETAQMDLILVLRGRN